MAGSSYAPWPQTAIILDPSGTIRRFDASDSAGEPLEWEKVRKNAWVVRTGGGTVRATYELYANSVRNRTRYADDSHVFLLGVGPREVHDVLDTRLPGQAQRRRERDKQHNRPPHVSPSLTSSHRSLITITCAAAR